MKKLKIASMLAALLLALVGPVVPVQAEGESPPQKARNMELVGQIGGTVYTVAVQGNYAYIGMGPRLVVVDVSVPTRPRPVGQTRVLPDVVQDVTVVGKTAYLADGAGGLWVVDVSDPAHPADIGFYDSPGTAWDIEIAKDYAYLSDGDGGLRIVDVSNPANLVEVSVYDAPEYVHKALVTENTAYVATNEGLQIVDMSDPAHPIEIGSYNAVGTVSDMATVGENLYLAERDHGLQVVRLSDLAHPVEYNIEVVFTLSIVTVGHYAYLVEAGGLKVLDIANLNHPKQIGYYYSPWVYRSEAKGWPPYALDGTDLRAVAVAGNYAYIAHGIYGLRVVDISDPANPAEVGYYNPPGAPHDVAIADNTAYVADRSVGLHMMDISDPTSPTEAGAYDTPGDAHGVAVAGGLTYVADGYGGLQVMDTSNPAHPTKVGHYDSHGNAGCVHISGKTVYLVYDNGLQILDVSDPANPVEVNYYDMPGNNFYTLGIDIAGDYIYIAHEHGLQVVDVSIPANPVEVGHYDVSNSAGGSSDVAVSGKTAYLSQADSLWVVDISNPAHPKKVGFYHPTHHTEFDFYSTQETPFGGSDVAVTGNYVYLADGNDLWMIDVSDPAHPIEVGYYPIPGNIHGLATDDGLVYLAAGEAGVYILQTPLYLDALQKESRGYLDCLRQTAYNGFYGSPSLPLPAYDTGAASDLLDTLTGETSPPYRQVEALGRLTAQQRAMCAALESYSTLNSDMADLAVDVSSFTAGWMNILPRPFPGFRKGAARAYGILQDWLNVLSWGVPESARGTVRDIFQMAGDLLRGRAGDSEALAQAFYEPTVRQEVAQYGLTVLLRDTQPMLNAGVQSVREMDAPTWEMQGRLQSANLQMDSIEERARLQAETAHSLYQDFQRAQDVNGILQDLSDMLTAERVPFSQVASLWTRIQQIMLYAGKGAVLHNAMDCIHALSIQSGPLAFNPSQRMAQCDTSAAPVAVDADAWEYAAAALQDASQQQETALQQMQASLEQENSAALRDAAQSWQDARQTWDASVAQMLAVLTPTSDRPAAPAVQALGEQLVLSEAASLGLELAVEAYAEENTPESRALTSQALDDFRSALAQAVTQSAALRLEKHIKAGVPLLVSVPQGISPRSDGSLLFPLAVVDAGSAPLEDAVVEIWTPAGEKWAETPLPAIQPGARLEATIAVPPLPEDAVMLRLTLRAGPYQDTRYLPILPVDTSALAALQRIPWLGPLLLVIGGVLLGTGLWGYRKERT